MIDILEKKNMGAFICAHVIQYLPPDTCERVLRLGAKSLRPGGIGVLCYRALAVEVIAKGLPTDYGDQSPLFMTIMGEGGLEPLTNTLIVPEIPTKLWQKIFDEARNKPEARGNRAWINNRVQQFIKGKSARLVEIDPTNDREDRFEYHEGDKTYAVGMGVRMIAYRKPDAPPKA